MNTVVNSGDTPSMLPASQMLQFSRECDRLRGLQGNHGRTIRRFIERYLPQGALVIRFEAPSTDSVLRAFFAGLAERVVERATELEAIFQVPFRYELSVEPEVQGVQVRLVPHQPVPGGMSAQQEFLYRLADAVACLNELENATEATLRALEAQVYSEFERSDARQVYGPMLDRLLAGDASDVRRAPLVLVSLAAHVRPELREHLS